MRQTSSRQQSRWRSQISASLVLSLTFFVMVELHDDAEERNCEETFRVGTDMAYQFLRTYSSVGCVLKFEIGADSVGGSS